MKRWMVILAMGCGVVFALSVMTATHPVLAQDGHGEETGGEDGGGDGAGGEAAGDNLAALRGAAVYAEFCQACHGPAGEGMGEGDAFAAITFNEESARKAIAEGWSVGEAAVAAMPAYDDVLSDEQIEDLIAYMATWETGDAPPLPEPNIHVEEELEAGAILYAKFCAGCHGVNGEGRGHKAFPRLDVDTADLDHVIRQGHQSVYMLAFGEEHGGPLNDEQIGELEAYLVTLQPEETGEEEDQRGYSLLIVVSGVIAILIVGAVYMARMIYTAE